jgi:hypothetical protein
MWSWCASLPWAAGPVAYALQTQDDQQKCSGMYSKKSWGGPVDPFIEVKFVDVNTNTELDDPTVSVIVWEWKDSTLLRCAAFAEKTC